MVRSVARLWSGSSAGRPVSSGYATSWVVQGVSSVRARGRRFVTSPAVRGVAGRALSPEPTFFDGLDQCRVEDATGAICAWRGRWRPGSGPTWRLLRRRGRSRFAAGVGWPGYPASGRSLYVRCYSAVARALAGQRLLSAGVTSLSRHEAALGGASVFDPELATLARHRLEPSSVSRETLPLVQVPMQKHRGSLHYPGADRRRLAAWWLAAGRMIPRSSATLQV